MFPHVLYGCSLALGVSLLIAASLHDIAARTIPNWVPLIVAIAGMAARTLQGDMLPSIAISSAVFLAAIFCWLRGWMGGGDVKLLGAAATTVPACTVLSMIAYVALAGGVLAILYLAMRALAPAPGAIRPHSLLARVWRAECWRVRRGCPLPYACAIMAGAVITHVLAGA